MRGNVLESRDEIYDVNNNDLNSISSKVEVIQDKTEKRATKKPKCELTEFNTYLFHEGENYNAYNFMGAHFTSENRKRGVTFTLWAPKG